jgi:hypothetical protein
MTHLPPHSKEKGFTPEDDQGEGSVMSERASAALKALKAVYHWADSRCPCHNDEPNPCPLCGASVENLQACKSVESIFPANVLSDVRSAIRMLEA